MSLRYRDYVDDHVEPWAVVEMKLRKNTFVDPQYYYFESQFPYPLSGTSTTGNVYHKEGRMADEWGDGRRSGRPKLFRRKDCQNISFEFQTGAESSVFSYLVKPGFSTVGDSWYRCPSRLIVETVRPQLNYDYAAASIEAIGSLFKQSSLPRVINIDRDPFDTEFSVWYSVVDMLDLARLFKSVLKGLIGFDRRNLKKDSRTAKQLHDANLLTRFGIIPTIRDMQEVVSILKTWKEKYDNSRDNLLKGRRYRLDPVSLTWLYPRRYNGIAAINFPGTSYPVSVDYRSFTEVTWHGSLDYRFHCPEFSGWLARLKQLVDSFGILDPAALWDVIPFSFVLDWFFTTSEWIHSFKPRLFPADVYATDYSESVAYKTIILYGVTSTTFNFAFEQFTRHDTVPSFTSYRSLIGTDIYKTYVRQRFKPLATHIRIVSKSPSLKSRRKSAVDLNRVSVAASLIGQRIPR